MTAMATRPLLLRSTPMLSKRERTAALVRGELARRYCKVSDLADILDISKYRAAKLWSGAHDYTLPQMIRLSMAFELEPHELLMRAVGA